jgi:exodeoxyribonuclease-5
MELSKEQAAAFDAVMSWNKNQLDKKSFLLGGLAGCVDKDTEYLTRTGWKPVSEYSGEEIAQWKPSGEVEFIKPEDFIKAPSKKLNRIKTTTIDMLVSDNHRMPYITSKGNHAVKTFDDLKNLAAVKIPRSFAPPINTKGVDVSDEMLRVLVMQSADGYMFRGTMTINVKKQEKQERVPKLLKEAGINFTVNKSSPGYKRFRYRPPHRFYTKDISELWECSFSQMKIIYEELLLWDGSTFTRNGKLRKTVCGNKKNMDFYQYVMSCVSGKYVGISKDKREYVKEPIYEVRESCRGVSYLEFFRGDIVSKEKTKDGFQYCFTTPSGFWLCRSKGKIIPTGNSGKTTLLAKIIEALNDNTRLLCCAPTGKAASVLSKKLNDYPVSTIHKALYRPMPADDSEVVALQEKVADNPDNTALQQELDDAICRFNAAQVTFAFVGAGSLTVKDIIIIDEASMVTEKIKDDLLATGARVLFVGDHGQLPPVMSKRWFENYDAVLRKIHRQALDNPIIRLSQTIRETGGLGDVQKTEGYEIVSNYDFDELRAFDQIIVGKNKTRWHINKNIRALSGYTQGSLHEGEKIICLRNKDMGDTRFLNGVQGVTTSNVDISFGEAHIDMQYDDNKRLENVPLYMGYFDENYGQVAHPPWFDLKNVQEFDFGYAITCHKSQGSEWDKVAVVDDDMFWDDPENRKRWLYTAVTRAKSFVKIIGA